MTRDEKTITGESDLCTRWSHHDPINDRVQRMTSDQDRELVELIREARAAITSMTEIIEKLEQALVVVPEPEQEILRGQLLLAVKSLLTMIEVLRARLPKDYIGGVI